MPKTDPKPFAFTIKKIDYMHLMKGTRREILKGGGYGSKVFFGRSTEAHDVVRVGRVDDHVRRLDVGRCILSKKTKKAGDESVTAELDGRGLMGERTRRMLSDGPWSIGPFRRPSSSTMCVLPSELERKT